LIFPFLFVSDIIRIFKIVSTICHHIYILSMIYEYNMCIGYEMYQIRRYVDFENNRA